MFKLLDRHLFLQVRPTAMQLDTEGPVLESFELDMEAGTLVLAFDEPIKACALSPTRALNVASHLVLVSLHGISDCGVHLSRPGVHQQEGDVRRVAVSALNRDAGTHAGAALVNVRDGRDVNCAHLAAATLGFTDLNRRHC